MGGVRTYLLSKEFLILNGLLAIVFITIAYNMPFRPTDELLLYFSDSKTYFNAGEEFFLLAEQGDSITRPFLYPVFLRGCFAIGGSWLVFILQSLFWIISGNLIYLGIKQITSKLLFRIAAVILYAVNISLITYTFYGLTESITVLLLSILTYYTTKTLQSGLTIEYALKIVLLLSLLTVIKPLFQHPTLFFTLFVIIRFFKQFIVTKKRIVMLLLAISPIVLQVTVMKLKYDKFQISTISERTMNNYLLAQGVREIQGISDVKRSQEIVQKMKPAEKRSYLMNHRNVYLKLYLNNIADNVTGYKSSVIAPPGYDITKQQNVMSRYNETLFSVSRYFLLLFILISVVDFFRKRMFSNWQQLTIGLLLYYIVFASGISFWQGDRLVVFAIPLWITLYCLLLIRCINSNFATVLFQQLKGLSK